MKEQYDGEYAARLAAIDSRIEDLYDHMRMWGRAGGKGGAMAMEAQHEINELKAEKERILNGTQAKIDKLYTKIKTLTEEKKQHSKINVIKQIRLSKEIKQQQREIETLKRR